MQELYLQGGRFEVDTAQMLAEFVKDATHLKFLDIRGRGLDV